MLWTAALRIGNDDRRARSTHVEGKVGTGRRWCALGDLGIRPSGRGSPIAVDTAAAAQVVLIRRAAEENLVELVLAVREALRNDAEA